MRNALPLLGLNYRAGLADMPDCACAAVGWKKRLSAPSTTASEFARSGITSGSGQLDVGYLVDNVLPPFQGEKCVVFLAILAVARMVICTTRNMELYDDANFSS